MKKSMILLVLVLGFCLSACSAKENTIVLPPTEEITSIEISGGIEDVICTEKEVIASFVQKVREAKPSNKESVQDVPTVSEYTKVDLVCDGKISSLFIYQEDSKWYIEQTYEVICETDESILSLLKETLQ